MRTARLALLGLSLCLLAACGVSSATGPEHPPEKEAIQNCGYLGSAGCPAIPAPGR